MNYKTKIISLASLAAALMIPVFSNAAIISVSGDGIIVSAPGSTLIDAAEGSMQMGFNEAQGVLLTTPLVTDNGILGPGLPVSSHMIFLDRDEDQTTGGLTTTATWVFDGLILGILSYENEYSSSSLLGNTGTLYPSSPYEENRGLEISEDGHDGYTVLANSLELKMRVTTPGDWIRVVTAYIPNNEERESVPDNGSSLLLLIGGFAALIGFKRFRTA